MQPTNLELQTQTKIVRTFSKNMKMEFDIEKTVLIHEKRGVVQATSSITLTNGSGFYVFSPEETDKYLGVQQILTSDEN